MRCVGLIIQLLKYSKYFIVQGVAMRTTVLTLVCFFAQMPLFSLSPSSLTLLRRSKNQQRLNCSHTEKTELNATNVLSLSLIHKLSMRKAQGCSSLNAHLLCTCSIRAAPPSFLHPTQPHDSRPCAFSS